MGIQEAEGLTVDELFVVKTITIMSDIANSVLLASDNGPSGGPINHVDIVKGCINGITLLGHVSAEFERKCKNNLRNIVHRDFVALCGPKPGPAAYKAKPRNKRSKYLLGGNLKQAAKYAKRSGEINKIPIERTLRCKVSIISTDQKTPLLDHGSKTGQNFSRQSTKQGQQYNNNRHCTARKFCK